MSELCHRTYNKGDEERERESANGGKKLQTAAEDKSAQQIDTKQGARRGEEAQGLKRE